MRRNTKLTFTKREDRPPLSPEEVRYWETILRKVCKVGVEYEYNLAESRGSCGGNTYICPCSHPQKEERRCYAQCVVYDKCKLRKKHGCPGIDCVLFKSPCATCTEAVRDCKACELYNDPDKKPDRARKKIEKALMPTKNLSDPGQFGTFEVIKDGSLLGDGGVEVTTVGRRVSFDSFLEQACKIVDECVKAGAFVNERTSLHMHLVAGYFDLAYNNGQVQVVYTKRNSHAGSHIKELEKDVPEIILANFHQLLRRYHNALTWITSSGNKPNTLTRWAKFRRPILQYSALRSKMQRVVQEIAGADEHRGKYMFMNYTSVQFNDWGNIKRLHVEGRFADGLLSPSAIASLSVLLYALLIKAVSLSQHGILHSGDRDYMEQAKQIRGVLLNNEGGYGGPRTSDTSGFEPYKETVRKEAEEMINILHSELRKHGPALQILQKLAEKPCSLRLIDGDSWETIEADLSGKQKNTNTHPAKKQVLEVIDTFYIDDCVDEKEWVGAVSQDLGISSQNVRNIVKELVSQHRIIWDGVVGTFVRC